MAQSTLPLNAPPSVGTFTALREANFRLYFIGQLISMSGTWMQTVAQGYLVFSLTRSELWLGVVACAAGLPMLFVAPLGGVVVEWVPRRRLLMVTATVQMLLAFILAALVFADHVQIWHIVTLALLLGTTNAFDAPARQTFISDLVRREVLVSGIAMNSIIINGSRMFGPAIAGLFLTTFGAAWCFLLNGVSFLAVIVMLAAIRLVAPHAAKHTRPLEELRSGLAYARHEPVVRSILLLAVTGGLFGWSIVALFPAFSDVVLGSPEAGLAAISTMNGLGAVVAGLIVTQLGRKIGRGRVILINAGAVMLTMVVFAATRTVLAAALVSMVLGFTLIAYFVTMNMTIQTTLANEFRGRVMSLYTLCIIGLNPFGALLMGGVAGMIGTPAAFVINALCFGVIAAAVLIRSPELRATP